MERRPITKQFIRRGVESGTQKRFDGPSRLRFFMREEYRAQRRLDATLAEIKAEGVFAKPATEEV